MPIHRDWYIQTQNCLSYVSDSLDKHNTKDFANAKNTHTLYNTLPLSVWDEL